MQKPFIICEPEKCTGCQLCEFACSSRYGEYNPILSRIRLVRVEPVSIMAIACRLCDIPTCMNACPRSCITISETTGIMLVDKDVCNGCGWCVEACEFGAVAINHQERIVSICNLCEDRGKEPRCVQMCVYGALSLATPADIASRRRREIVQSGILPEMDTAEESQK